MLTIRAPQMKALRDASTAAFVERAIAHVDTHFDSIPAGLGPQRVRTEVERVLECARFYKIRTQRDILRLINLVMVFGTRFPDDRAWATRVLKQPIDASDRMDLLFKIAAGALDDAARFEAENAPVAKAGCGDMVVTEAAFEAEAVLV